MMVTGPMRILSSSLNKSGLCLNSGIPTVTCSLHSTTHRTITLVYLVDCVPSYWTNRMCAKLSPPALYVSIQCSQSSTSCGTSQHSYCSTQTCASPLLEIHVWLSLKFRTCWRSESFQRPTSGLHNEEVFQSQMNTIIGRCWDSGTFRRFKDENWK